MDVERLLVVVFGFAIVVDDDNAPAAFVVGGLVVGCDDDVGCLRAGDAVGGRLESKYDRHWDGCRCLPTTPPAAIRILVGADMVF